MSGMQEAILIKDYYKSSYDEFCYVCEMNNQLCFEYGGRDYIIINRLGEWSFQDPRVYWPKGKSRPIYGPCCSMWELFDLKCFDGHSFKELYDSIRTFDDYWEDEEQA